MLTPVELNLGLAISTAKTAGADGPLRNRSRVTSVTSSTTCVFVNDAMPSPPVVANQMRKESWKVSLIQPTQLASANRHTTDANRRLRRLMRHICYIICAIRRRQNPSPLYRSTA